MRMQSGLGFSDLHPWVSHSEEVEDPHIGASHELTLELQVHSFMKTL